MSRFLLAAAVVVVLAALAPCADWPQFLGPDRNGTSAESGLLHEFPSDGLKTLWSFPLQEGFGGAAISGGEVFILDRLADKTDVLRCISVATGKELWNYSHDAPGKTDPKGPRSTPSVDDKHIWFVAPLGDVTCIDRSTHQAVWSINLLQDFGGKVPQWMVGQSPLVYKNMLIVAPQSTTNSAPASGPAASAPSQGPAGVVAYDKVTGKLLWKTPAIGEMAYTSPSVVKIDGMEQIVQASGGSTVGLDPADGKRLWMYRGWRGTAIAQPVPVGQGKIFLTEGYKTASDMMQVTHEGDQWTAKDVFATKKVGSQIHTPFLIGDVLYILSNSNDRHDGLVCMDLSGEVLWQTAKSPSFERGNAVYADGVLYIMEGNTGKLYCVQPDKTAYKQLGETKVLEGKDIWAPMAISDGKLFCRDQKQLKCVELKK